MLLNKPKHTGLIILIDPDKYNPALLDIANRCRVSYIFYGGSTLKKNNFQKVLKDIKSRTAIPVVIFPGDEKQVSSLADGILILSLLSGRNADYLIGKHVAAASRIRAAGIPAIPTAYILIDGGQVSATQHITSTKPLHRRKEILDTVAAGELLGKRLIYLEAGSGARKSLSQHLIQSVKAHTSLPLIVGGGIDSVEKAARILAAGPDYIVVGNVLEKNPTFLTELDRLMRTKRR